MWSVPSLLMKPEIITFAAVAMLPSSVVRCIYGIEGLISIAAAELQ